MGDPMKQPVRIIDILGDPAVSRWLQGALREALGRDPVDAANDAELLYEVLKRRCDTFLGEVTT